MDAWVAKTGLFYCRYMDDEVTLAPTRWKLRAAIRVVNATLAELKVEQHPDKTFIGRIAKRFDFLGYHFSPEGLSVARLTVERFVARACQLYEQEPPGQAALDRLGAYVRRWWQWVRAGVLGDRLEQGLHDMVMEGVWLGASFSRGLDLLVPAGV